MKNDFNETFKNLELISRKVNIKKDLDHRPKSSNFLLIL